MARRPPHASGLSSKTAYQAELAYQRRLLEDAKRKGDRAPDPDAYLLDCGDVARLLGSTIPYVRRLCETGQLGYTVQRYRHGHYSRQVRKIPRTELEAYLKRHFVIWARCLTNHISALRHGSCDMT